jgi:predicted pyridoxine 5'-phosphate oxidase superfamily flavin-nucleotide-binding protein
MSGSNGEKKLQQVYGTQKKATAFYKNQMLNYLNPMMQDFIAHQEMVFLATSDRNGNCDSSFRAGLPGFVRVVDERTILYPEYHGNGVFASLGNIIENPHIGLMFIDFLKYGIGLHVNGRATVVENAELARNLSDQLVEDIQQKEDHRAERWVVITVDEAYIHCSKHIPLMQKLNKTIHWGTDDEERKGADFFKQGLKKKDNG